MKKSLNIFLIIITLIMFFISIRPMETEATVEVSNGKIVLNTGYNTQNDAFEHIIEQYKTIISFFSAIAAVTMVGIFIYLFTKLGMTAGNPMERQKCITGLIISGVAAALLGSISLFVGLFYGIFK